MNIDDAMRIAKKLDAVDCGADFIEIPHHGAISVKWLVKFAEAIITEQRNTNTGQDQPVAWARKWHVDGEVPKKEKNSNGRMAWPFKFKLNPVTPHQCLKDDVPLGVINDDTP